MLDRRRGTYASVEEEHEGCKWRFLYRHLPVFVSLRLLRARLQVCQVRLGLNSPWVWILNVTPWCVLLALHIHARSGLDTESLGNSTGAAPLPTPESRIGEAREFSALTSNDGLVSAGATYFTRTTLLVARTIVLRKNPWTIRRGGPGGMQPHTSTT